MTSTLFSCSIARSLLLLLLCLGGLLDLVEHDIAIAAEPVRERHQLLPLGLIHAHPATTLMICGYHGERWQEATQSKILDALETLLNLLAGYGQAVLLDSEPDSLYHQSRNEHTPIVVHPADIVRYFLVFRLIHLDNVLDHWEVPPYTGKLHAQIALGRVPSGGPHVFLAGPPYQADHLVEGETVFLELFNRHGRGIAKEVSHNPIGPHTTCDIEHLRGHLNAGCWHRKVPALIAFHLADTTKDRQGLTSCRVIVKEIGDLRALLGAMVLQKLHRRTHLRPVRCGHGKDIGIALTVGGIGPPETRGQTRNFILHMARCQSIHNRCAVIEQHYRPITFQAFVRFHT